VGNINYEELRGRLVAAAYRRIENYQDAEDLAHDALLYALKKVKREGLEKRRIVGLAFSKLRYLCLNYLERLNNTIYLDEVDNT